MLMCSRLLPRIMDQVHMMNMLWSVPLQIGVSLYLLWQQLGIATLGGVFVMILLMPVNAVVTAYLRKYQVKHFNHSGLSE